MKENSDPELTDWGISVPLLKSRSLQISRSLAKSKIGFLRDYLISKEDLIHAGHHKKFIEDVFSNNDELVDPILKETYELVNQDGTYHRYNPENQKKRFHELFMCQLVEASNSYQCAKKAIIDRAQIFYLSGGMHHAMSHGGRGFCLFNDAVVAIRKLQKQGDISRAWVIDVDVHKGDGTAQMTEGDDSIITFSAHMKHGWPMDQGDGPWMIPSNLDVAIAEGENHQYLIKLREGLFRLKEEFDSPDFIFVNLGGDPYEKDVLKSAELIQLSREEMLQRNEMVYRFAREMSVPVLWTMGGGYGEHSYETYVDFFNKISPEVREADIFEVA